MDLKEIHKAISTKVKTTFNIPCYARDTKEITSKPCFFLELNQSELSQDNKVFDDYMVQIELTYVCSKRDDITFYNIIEQMKSLFKHRVRIDLTNQIRYLQVTSFSSDYVGDNDEQLVFDIDTRFKDINTLAGPTELMSELELNEEII